MFGFSGVQNLQLQILFFSYISGGLGKGETTEIFIKETLAFVSYLSPPLSWQGLTVDLASLELTVQTSEQSTGSAF